MRYINLHFTYLLYYLLFNYYSIFYFVYHLLSIEVTNSLCTFELKTAFL